MSNNSFKTKFTQQTVKKVALDGKLRNIIQSKLHNTKIHLHSVKKDLKGNNIYQTSQQTTFFCLTKNKILL